MLFASMDPLRKKKSLRLVDLLGTWKFKLLSLRRQKSGPKHGDGTGQVNALYHGLPYSNTSPQSTRDGQRHLPQLKKSIIHSMQTLSKDELLLDGLLSRLSCTAFTRSGKDAQCLRQDRCSFWLSRACSPRFCYDNLARNVGEPLIGTDRYVASAEHVCTERISGPDGISSTPCLTRFAWALLPRPPTVHCAEALI